VIALGEFAGEAFWCCNFHGPLGLHLLKATLAPSNGKEVYYNFPVDFTSPVIVNNQHWSLTSQTVSPKEGEVLRCRLTMKSTEGNPAEALPLNIRQPEWADEVTVNDGSGSAVEVEKRDGYLRLMKPCRSGQELDVAFRGGVILEDRRFHRISLNAGEVSRHKGVVLRYGPQVLFAEGAPEIMLPVDAKGRPNLGAEPDGSYRAISLPAGVEGVTDLSALRSSTVQTRLSPLPGNGEKNHTRFVLDVLAIPGR